MSRVLFVDDDATIQKIATKWLEGKGIVFSEGQDLVAAHKASPSDTKIIIVDLQMPGYDGFQTLNDIRDFDNGRGSKTKVYALSGDYDDDDVVEKVNSVGFDGLIPKPLKKALIESII